MADITPVPASFRVGQDSRARLVQYGVAVAPGRAVYQHTDNKWLLSNNSTTILAKAGGITLTGNALDGW